MYLLPDGFCLLLWAHPRLVIPAKAGTQEISETKWFFNNGDELYQKGFKWLHSFGVLCLSWIPAFAGMTRGGGTHA